MNEYKAVLPLVIYFIHGKQKKKRAVFHTFRFSVFLLLNADTVKREYLVSVYSVKIPLYMISDIYKISTLKLPRLSLFQRCRNRHKGIILIPERIRNSF